jgi:hypothetical protein
MPDTVDVSKDEASLAALVAAAEWQEAASRKARFHSAHERALAALESRRAELNALYERAVAPESGRQEITRAASMIGEAGRAAAEKLSPQLDAVQRKLAHRDTSSEVRRMREQTIAVAEAWLALYRELHAELLRLAAERRPAGEILRARPVEGEGDHEALTREIIARFPKILAALAE